MLNRMAAQKVAMVDCMAVCCGGCLVVECRDSGGDAAPSLCVEGASSGVGVGDLRFLAYPRARRVCASFLTLF